MLECGHRCISVLERLEWLEHIPGDAPRAAFRVCQALSRCCNKNDGKCNPGRARLEEMTGMKQPNITRALKWLQEAGLIVETKSTTRSKQWMLIYRCERYQSCTCRGINPAHARVSILHTRTNKKEPIESEPTQNSKVPTRARG